MTTLMLKPNIHLALGLFFSTCLLIGKWLMVATPFKWVVILYILHQSQNLIAKHVMRHHPEAILALHPHSKNHLWVESPNGLHLHLIPAFRPMWGGYLLQFKKRACTLYWPSHHQKQILYAWHRAYQCSAHAL